MREFEHGDVAWRRRGGWSICNHRPDHLVRLLDRRRLGDPDGSVGVTGVEACTFYGSVSSSSATTLKAHCMATGTATVVDSCPTVGLTGTCAHTFDGSSLTEVDSSYSADGAEALQKQCATEGGTWSAS
jgi:hypothetical protein